MTAYGRNFSGDGQYVRIPGLSISATSRTIMFWVARVVSDRDLNHYTLIGEWASSYPNGIIWENFLANGSPVKFNLASGNLNYYNSGTGEYPTTEYSFVHFAYTQSGTKDVDAEAELFVNGVSVDTEVNPAYVGSETLSDLTIGSWLEFIGESPYLHDFRGMIADFRIYEKRMSEVEVANIYAAGVIDPSPDTVNLVARYFLGDDDVLDKSGVGPDGTNYGTTQGDSAGIPLPVVPNAPVLNAGSSTSSTSFEISWSEPANAGGYEIDVAEDEAFTTLVAGYNPNVINLATITSLEVTGITEPVYYCRVRAFNISGTSGNSNVVTITMDWYTEYLAEFKKKEYFLNSKSSVANFETIELSHPNFSKTYYFVRNSAAGITATLETDVEVDFEYIPLKITQSSTSEDLDYSLVVDFGDVGEILSLELDLAAAADALKIQPQLTYRTFRSDDLTTPLFGPVVLNVKNINFNRTAATIEASADKSNSLRTGELYTINRFPTLRAFL